VHRGGHVHLGQPVGRAAARQRRAPVPGVELTIQDEAGRGAPAGQDGEICVRSPGVMTGYWHSEDTSALAGGWLHTGDIGHVDGDGYLTWWTARRT
jgi:Acyl-CoA synthetases (AMP-forming)/AMP-acid ligases II